MRSKLPTTAMTYALLCLAGGGSFLLPDELDLPESWEDVAVDPVSSSPPRGIVASPDPPASRPDVVAPGAAGAPEAPHLVDGGAPAVPGE